MCPTSDNTLRSGGKRKTQWLQSRTGGGYEAVSPAQTEGGLRKSNGEVSFGDVERER